MMKVQSFMRKVLKEIDANTHTALLKDTEPTILQGQGSNKTNISNEDKLFKYLNDN